MFNKKNDLACLKTNFMEVKNLFDAAVKQEIIARINKFTPQSQRQCGKIDVAQMLAHCQMPLGVVGELKLKGSFFIKLDRAFI